MVSQNTKIEWTDASWPVIRGCSKVSEGCRNCWAIRDAHLHSGKLPPDETRTRVIEAHRKAAAHFQGLTRIENGRPNWTGTVRLDESILDWPLKWRKPKRIFAASSGDLFHESLPFRDILRVYRVMQRSPQHTFQVLTKRPQRRLELMPKIIANLNSGGSRVDPLRNVWEGVSCEDQPTADVRIVKLLQTPAAVRFVSLEPLLGPVDLRRVRTGQHLRRFMREFATATGQDPDAVESECAIDDTPWCNALRGEWFDGWDSGDDGEALDWVIVGGESGPGARPCEIAWIRSIVEQCADAGVPCFVKQLGSEAHSLQDHIAARHHRLEGREQGEFYRYLSHSKGGDPTEWPEDLRVRQMPEVKR